MKSRWRVYIVSCADGTLYTGIATDVKRRVTEHNTSPSGARYTSGRRPVSLLYVESADSRSHALVREHAIKKLRKKEKLALLRAFTRKKRS